VPPPTKRRGERFPPAAKKKTPSKPRCDNLQHKTALILFCIKSDPKNTPKEKQHVELNGNL